SLIRLAQPRCVVQEPNQVAVRVQAILLCSFNQTVDHSAGLGAGGGVGKEPVLPAHDKGLYAALGTVVGELQPAVLQIAYQVGPLLPQIVQCLAQGRLGCRFGAGLICPCQQSVQNRFLQFQPLGIVN